MPIGDAIRAGRAYIELSLHDPNLQKQLSDVQKRFNSLGRSMRKFGSIALGAGSAIAGSFAMPIKAASDAQETLSKFSVVFGDLEDEAMAFTEALAKSIGRSKYELAANMSSFQDLFQPMGMAADDAFEMSKTMTKLAEDLASFNNLQTADVIRDLQAAMTGSGETMKKYGVILTEAAIKDKLAEMGLASTEVNKALARQEIILGATTAAQGDAERTAGGFANQMKALQAAIHDTMVAIGEDLIPIVTPMVTKLAEAAQGVGEWAAANSEVAKALLMGGGIVAGVGALATGLGMVSAAFTTLLGMPIVATLTGILAVATALTVAFSDWADAIRKAVHEYLALDSTRGGESGSYWTPLGRKGGKESSWKIPFWQRESALNPISWFKGWPAEATTRPADFQASATPRELKEMRDLAKKQLREQERMAELLGRQEALVFE